MWFGQRRTAKNSDKPKPLIICHRFEQKIKTYILLKFLLLNSVYIRTDVNEACSEISKASRADKGIYTIKAKNATGHASMYIKVNVLGKSSLLLFSFYLAIFLNVLAYIRQTWTTLQAF